jgi:60 kDa SS-A/Ro ribonucleoprotein
MKDMPALLCAVLARRSVPLLGRVFDRVINDGKMLRIFVQIVRSGAAGRKSFGTAPRRLLRRWLEAREGEVLLRMSVGTKPSLGDVLRMVHPRPSDAGRSALYAYFLGKPHDEAALPDLARRLEAFRRGVPGARGPVPQVPFQMLGGLRLTTAEWAEVAATTSWQTLRMNLNTFARHGAFRVEGVADLVARRIADAAEIARARAFPYQLLAAYHAAATAVPGPVRQALVEAADLALANVPRLPGRVHVCIDVSGSMGGPITGRRRGATTSVRCIDVAALVAAAVLRRNPDAEVLAFNDRAARVVVDPEASVLENAARLSRLLGGGTACGAPLRLLNDRGARGDLVLFVSDLESWADRCSGRATGMLHEWRRFRERNPEARLACIDLQAGATTQAPEGDDVLNVGGFSDSVFEVLEAYASGRLEPGHWVERIEAVSL